MSMDFNKLANDFVVDDNRFKDTLEIISVDIEEIRTKLMTNKITL